MELAYALWDPHHISSQPNPRRITFLHGMGGTGALWRPIAAALEDEFAVLAPDQRGHGASPRAQSYSPLDYGTDVVDTLRVLSFHPTWLVGHSMGVRSAIACAHLQPKWITGLVLIDLGFSGSDGGSKADELARFVGGLPHGFPTRAEAREFMTKTCPDPAIVQYLMAVLKEQSGGVVFPFDGQALIQTVETARNLSLRSWVADYADQGGSALILRGEKSLLWTQEDYLRERESFKNRPQVQFMEFKGAGHGLPFEKRPEFIAVLKDFIPKHS